MIRADLAMDSDISPSTTTKPPSRFELELEFVTLLASPFYLNHLAAQKLFSDPAFVAYLAYLQYWTRPEYVRYLEYPQLSTHALKLLQKKQFRRDILGPEYVARTAADFQALAS